MRILALLTLLLALIGPAAAQVLPQGATSVAAVGTGTTGAATATIAATANRTNFLCGFSVSAIGGTATLGPITITGLLGGTQTYQLASTATGITLSVPFGACIPASGVNVAIAIVTTADGSASAVDVNSWGYLQ